MNDFMNKIGYRILFWLMNVAGMSIIFAVLYFTVFFSSAILLEDKKYTANISEGKYIINVLSEEYEKILKEKGKNLDVEKIRLLNQRALAKSQKEKAEIEKQLRKIESEKKNFNNELKNNEKQRKEVEAALRNTKVDLEQTKMEITRLNQKNIDLMAKIQALESSSKNSVDAINNYENLKNKEKELEAKYESRLQDVISEKDRKISALTLDIGKLREQLNGMESAGAFRLDNTYNDPVVYKGKMILTIKNQLRIFTKDKKLLKAVNLVSEDENLTKPAVSDGIIYTGSDGGGLIACDESGKLLWKQKAGIQKFGASPSASSGLVAAPSIDDGIYIYDKKGRYITKVDADVPIYSAPLIISQGKILIYATENGIIIAYDIVHKKEIWTKNHSQYYSDRILYPLMGNDKTILFLDTSGKLSAISSADGSLHWEADFPEIKDTMINPQLIDGKVILANNIEKSIVIIVNSDNGTIKTRWSLDNEKISTPYIDGKSIYFNTASGNIYSYIIPE